MRTVLLFGAAVATMALGAGWYAKLSHSPAGEAPSSVARVSLPEPAAAPPASAPPAAAQASSARAAGPSLDVVRVGPDGSAVVAGRAEPGAAVTVTDGGRPIGTATADRRGEWVVVPADPLGPGARAIGVEARPPGGGEARRSEDVALLLVPEPKAASPGAPAAPSGAVAVAIPGAGPARLLQAPPADGVTLDVVEYDEKGALSVGGRAEPGAEIRLSVDGRPAGSARADAAGRWTAMPGDAVSPGDHRLEAERIEGGRATERASIPFRMARAEELAAPAPGRIVVQPGNSLWRIARRSYGEGTRFVEIHRANRERIDDPDLIFPGQVLVVPDAAPGGAVAQR